MMFEFTARYADGHVALVSDHSPRLARERARKSYRESPLAQMIDGWNSVNWSADREPLAYRKAWTSRGKCHAWRSGERAICGTKVALTSSTLFPEKFDPADTDSCGKCRREVIA